MKTSLTPTPSQINEYESNASTQITVKVPKIKKQEECKKQSRPKKYHRIDDNGERYSSDTCDPSLGPNWYFDHNGDIVKRPP